MGCVSSKQAKQQARLEEKWGKISPGRRKPFDSSSHNELSFEDYHRHLVALTSSSYGLLKVDTPKPPEEVRRSTARVRSLDDLYDRLNVLESMESAPNSWNVNGVLQTLIKPGPERSISMPVHHTNMPAVQETINVSDIMQGLEEGVSSSSSPSKDVGSIAAASVNKLQPPPSPPSPEKVSTRRHIIFDKMASFAHSNEGYAGPEKLPMMRAEIPSKVLAHTATHSQGKFEKPSSEEHLPVVMQTRRNRAHQGQHVPNKTLLVPDESKEVPMENRSLLSSKLPSGVSYSASSRRLKLTLNLEYEGTVFAGMQMGYDACNSAGSSARRSIVDALTEPDSPLFDPALLASYEKALKELRKEDWSIADDASDLFEKMRLTKETAMDVDAEPSENCEEASVVPSSTIQSFDPLSEFEWRCPPGGEEAAVLYTTTLHGIRKTFEDCNNVRDILKGFNVGFHERDVSMHATYRNELRELLGGRVSVPSMFIKGRYIGGVDDAVRLHEEGKLSALLKGLPKDLNNEICDGCGDMRFVPCLACSGSCKVVDHDKSVSRCPECNENGLIPCPICA